MVKFLLQVLLFVSLLATTLMLFGNKKKPPDYNNFLAAIIDKHKRLDSIGGPRLILAGGSSVAFGIDSKKIQDEFHIPVINTALLAGLGLTFITNELNEKMRKGDIILLSTEYYLSDEGDKRLRSYAAYIFPEAASYYKEDPINQLSKTIEEKSSALRERIVNPFAPHSEPEDDNTIYHRNYFNEFGDMVGQLNRPAQIKQKNGYVFYYKDHIKYFYHHYKGIETLNRFYDSAEKKGVKVYFLFPNYPESEYNNNKDFFARHYRDMIHDLKIPILNKPTDFVYPDSLHFDYLYHLNKEGREIKTRDVISIIKKYQLIQPAQNKNP